MLPITGLCTDAIADTDFGLGYSSQFKKTIADLSKNSLLKKSEDRTFCYRESNVSRLLFMPIREFHGEMWCHYYDKMLDKMVC